MNIEILNHQFCSHKTLLLLLLALFPITSYPHGGGLDSNGGHHNRKTGEYHCHRAGCVVPGAISSTAAAQSKAAMKEAQHEGRPYSLVYDRRDWPHWIDADHDCQDTRAEILIATSKVPVRYRNEKKCSVVSGEWYDPYSGKTWTKASDLDLDHIITVVYNML